MSEIPHGHAITLDADALPCGWLRLEVGGRLHATNEPLRRLLGREQQALEGEWVDTLLAGGARVLYHSYLMPLLQLHGRVEEFALGLRHADGSTVDALVYAVLRPAEGGDVVEATLVPMRERRRLEDELLRVRRAAEMAPGVIFQIVSTSSGGLAMTYASDALRRLYQLTPEQVRRDAAPLLDRVDPAHRARVADALRAAAPSGREWRDRFRVVLPGRGEAWHEARAVARLDAGGRTVWHGFIADVTDQRTLEGAVREKEAAESASRAKSRFLARMSHELRTPLNGILGFARLLRIDESGTLSAEQRRRLGIIEDSGRSLTRLIDQVLDITRIEQGGLALRREPVPLRPLLEHALRMVEAPALARGITLAPVDCPPPLAVLADRDRLAQVLANLLSNAVKYDRPGGRVTLTASQDGCGVRIAVADTGPGLSEDQQRQLFQPFNRLGAERTGVEGVGLGLLISRQLVELMGGTITVLSAPGRGSEFAVRLAPAALPAPPAEVPAVPPRAAPSRPRRVLYVEDNPVNAMLMEAVFELRPGWSLEVVGDGTALERAALAAPPDLLLLDLHLPDGDGVELLRNLRRHAALAETPAVVVSAAAMPEDVARALAAGCAGYWTKPLDVDRALARMETLFGDA
ncbi:MAG: ATP-binding protein [Rubrivivax sp.]